MISCSLAILNKKLVSMWTIKKEKRFDFGFVGVFIYKTYCVPTSAIIFKWLDDDAAIIYLFFAILW